MYQFELYWHSLYGCFLVLWHLTESCKLLVLYMSPVHVCTTEVAAIVFFKKQLTMEDHQYYKVLFNR